MNFFADARWTRQIRNFIVHLALDHIPLSFTIPASFFETDTNVQQRTPPSKSNKVDF